MIHGETQIPTGEEKKKQRSLPRKEDSEESTCLDR